MDLFIFTNYTNVFLVVQLTLRFNLIPPGVYGWDTHRKVLKSKSIKKSKITKIIEED